MEDDQVDLMENTNAMIAPGKHKTKVTIIDNSQNFYDIPMLMKGLTHKNPSQTTEDLFEMYETSDDLKIRQSSDQYTDVFCPAGMEAVVLIPEREKFTPETNPAEGTPAMLVSKKKSIQAMKEDCVIRFVHSGGSWLDSEGAIKVGIIKWIEFKKAERPTPVSMTKNELNTTVEEEGSIGWFGWRKFLCL